MLCPKSHRGEGELGKESVLGSDFSSLCVFWLFIYLVPGGHSREP